MKIGEAIQKSEPCSNNRNYGMQGFLYEIAGADPVVRVFRPSPARGKAEDNLDILNLLE